MIINDLRQEDRFRQLPFVEGEPQSRFYAGTPLISDSGINLGCMFVLDPEPREGMSDIDKDTLETVAALVMDYLRVSRQAAEGKRASRLSRGLHLFVDGNSKFPDHSPVSCLPDNSGDRPCSQTLNFPAAMSRSTNSQSSGLEILSTGAEAVHAPSKNGEKRLSSPSDENLDIGVPASPMESSGSSHQSDGSSSDGGSSECSTSNLWLFHRAANLLRESLDLNGAGGVKFLATTEQSSENSAENLRYSTESQTPAPVLALSTKDDPMSNQMGDTGSSAVSNLDIEFLNQLTRRYPKGRLWSFHRDGTLSTSDEDESLDATMKQRKKSKDTETVKLNAYFPDACQVMFVPLWNATHSQWFAGCFCWTPQPERVFSRAVDLSSVFGFASSIMTEYSRVESAIADRQKGDFISSISHELRSPLHGVLAAAELFSGTGLNEFQESLLETIDACGRTLLDTMNQVLDFSKIMSFERSKRRIKRGRDLWKAKVPDAAPPRLDTSVSTDVAILTEDVVDSVFMGHCHMQKSTTSANPSKNFPATLPSKLPGDDDAGYSSNVELVVDIADKDWMYKVQPGLLRRLIMNLLGNALKYTKKGSVSVSLKPTKMSKGLSRLQGLEDMVMLTISDTGKGISKEYLRKRLYTPFSQEDTLYVGTGLGLSIVRNIVRTLNGTIKIQSQVGEGTTVKVSIPLEHPGGEEIPPTMPQVNSLENIPPRASFKLHHKDLQRKRAAIWGINYSLLDQRPFWSSIARYITDWYDMQLVPSTVESIDIMFADESDLSVQGFHDFPPALPNLVIFRNESGGSREPRVQWSHFASSLVILHRPCGPHKLARGISRCLGQKAVSVRGQPSLGQGLVIPERRKVSNPTQLVGEPKFLSSEYLRLPDADSLNPMPESSISVMYSTERDASSTSSDTKDHCRVTSSSAAFNTCALSSSTSSLSAPVRVDASSMKDSRPRVLIVDDNDINLRLMITFMKKRKVLAVNTAKNGRHAIDLVEENPEGYDLIFMDISMPVMNGFEATRAIRAIESKRDGCGSATIIAFTGLSSPNDETKAFDEGVNLFLTKPVSFKEVSRILNEWERNCENKPR